MKRNEIIEKLNEVTGVGQEITTKVLNANGITSKNITRLVSDGVLSRVRRGVYSYSAQVKKNEADKRLADGSSFEYFLNRMTNGYQEGNTMGAREDSPQREMSFKYFLDDLYKDRYFEVYDYLDEVYLTKDAEYLADANFYLFILDCLDRVSDRYKERAETLRLEDILLSKGNARYGDITTQNKLREMVFYGCYFSALKYTAKQKDNCVVIEHLIRRILSKRFMHELNLARNKDYDKLKEYLENFKVKSELSVLEESVLKLVRVLISGVVPERYKAYSANAFKAVFNNDFETAWSYAKKHAAKNNIDENSDILCVLLKEVVALMKGINIEKDDKSDSKAEVQVTPQIQIVSNNDYFGIIKALIANDEQGALKLLGLYLDSIMASGYYNYVKDLIKLSAMENDFSFAMPIVALTHLTIGTFEVDVSWYESRFYESLNAERRDLAEVYLDILSELAVLGKPISNLEELKDALYKNTEIQKVNTFENNANVNLGSAHSHEVDEPIEVFTLSDHKSTKKKGITCEPSESMDESIRKMIMARMVEIKRLGISILNPMDTEHVRKVFEVVQTMNDVSAFSMGAHPNKSLVLKSCRSDSFDVHATMDEANEAYRNGNFSVAIRKYRKVISHDSKPSAFIFAKMGLMFYRLGDKKTAIKYLTIATEISKTTKYDFDFYGLIEYLRTGKEAPERKPSFTMTEEEFERETDNYYGIQIDEIVDLICSGMKPEEACETMRLDEEESAMAMLFIARNMYIQGDEVVGDEYMKKVERMKNKTTFVKSLFDEIRLNRKFYKSRSEEGEKHFVLKPIIQTGKVTEN